MATPAAHIEVASPLPGSGAAFTLQEFVLSWRIPLERLRREWSGVLWTVLEPAS